jgi:RNA polymerase sigma-70 factor (ECF subfamily)
MLVVVSDPAALQLARAGDANAFQALVDPYRRELHLHCYRMLGSFHDAEDAVQETLLRAWRHFATFEARSSLRAWLYRIATNVCLRFRTRRPIKPPRVARVPDTIPHATEPGMALSPYPDDLLDELEAPAGNPDVEYDLRESVQIAFLAAVQLLPPRQRAVLILRDVAGFSAQEVAELLESTLASVNSALNRARMAIQHQREAGRLHLDYQPVSDAAADSIVHRYVEAWQAADINRLVGLLRRDVAMSMPPLPLRYAGRDNVVQFLSSVPALAERENFRFTPVRANRQPAVAIYRRDPGQASAPFRAWAVFVLTSDGDQIVEITAFIDAAAVSLFGLPTER